MFIRMFDDVVGKIQCFKLPIQFAKIVYLLI